MIKALVFTLMIPATVVMAESKVGSVAIYSDGQAEKLIEKGDGWTLWQDQRKRLYRKSNLPFMPLQSYKKFPDRTDGYSQNLVFGKPENIKPYGNFDVVRFEVKRDDGSFSVNRHWRCAYSGKGKFRLGKKKYKTDEYQCERGIYKKGTYYRLRETIDLAYSPTLALVVDWKRTGKNGDIERVELSRLLSPKKATAKRISRTVYGLRTSK